MARRSDLASQLKRSRQALGLSQSDAAARIRITRRTLHSWERGDSIPNPAMLPAIGEALEIDRADLETMRERAERNRDRLRRRPEAGHYAAVTSVPDAIFVAVSDAYAEMLGYQPDDLIGTPARDLLVESFEGEYQPQRDHIETAGFHVGEVMLRHRDGHDVRFGYRARPVEDGDGRMIVVTGLPA